jgi:hypothetical protein
VLGRYFGGATAFRQGRGVWRDDERGGQLIYDAPVIVQCQTREGDLEKSAEELRTPMQVAAQILEEATASYIPDRPTAKRRSPGRVSLMRSAMGARKPRIKR